jgi:hypothetical protein
VPATRFYDPPAALSAFKAELAWRGQPQFREPAWHRALRVACETDDALRAAQIQEAERHRADQRYYQQFDEEHLDNLAASEQRVQFFWLSRGIPSGNFKEIYGRKP